MNKPNVASRSASGLSSDMDLYLERFERAWASGSPPTLEDFLPLHSSQAPDDGARFTLLKELIKLDLEFRWKLPKANSHPVPRSLEEYLSNHLDLLRLGKMPLDLILEEYRVRHRWGDKPNHQVFLTRYPEHATYLAASLSRVDTELAAETSVGGGSQSSVVDSSTVLPAKFAASPDDADPYATLPPMPQRGEIDNSLDRMLEATAFPQVPGYEILGTLGRGGMGVVYKARHLALKRTVALKMIIAGAHASQVELARFQTEAEAVARLAHPNIVQIFEVGNLGGLPFFSLEYVEGGSLDKKLAGTPQKPREAAELVLTLAHSMYAAHQAGIIHRDLKPANVLVTCNGVPKITDFGLAKQLDSSDGHTPSDALMGTPSYMAPEQAAGKTQMIGPAADIYALGAILYEMLTGRPPFKAATVMETVMQVIEQEPVPPIQLQPRTPRDLDTICMKCLQKDPRKRYASAEALAVDLRHFLAGEPILARPVGAPERLWRWCRRKPAFATATAAAVCGLLLALATFTSAFFVVTDSRNSAIKLASEKDNLATLEHEERVKAQKLAEANKALAAEQTKARKEADQGREHAEHLATKMSFEFFYSRFADDPNLAFVGAATLLSKASRLKDRSLFDSMCLHLGAWGQESHRLTTISTHEKPVLAVAFSPNCKYVLTGSHDKTARLWESDTGKQIGPPLQHQDSVKVVAFSPDGNAMLTGSWDNTAKLWDVATGKSLGLPLQHQQWVVAGAFSPDGRTVLTGSWDKTAKLWDVATGKQIGPSLRHDDCVEALSYGPDGKVVITASRDKTARLWETATGKQIGPPLLHQDWVEAVAFHPNGRFVLTGSNDKTVRLWDVATGKQVGLPLQHQLSVKHIAFNKDGTKILTGSEHTARLWDVATGMQIGPPLQHQDWITAMAFSPDGKTVLTGSQDKTARLWDVATGKQVGPPLQHQHWVGALAFSPDGKQLVTGSFDKNARVWNLAMDRQNGNILRHQLPVQTAVFSPDSKTVVTANWDRAYLWDVATGKQIGPPLLHQDVVYAVAFSPDGKTVLTGSNDKTARLWETATGKQVGPSLLHQSNVWTVGFSANGRLMLTGTSTTGAQAWETKTGKPMGPLLEQYYPAGARSFSPDGRTLLVGGSDDNTATLWDTSTGQQIGPPLQHAHKVLHVAFSNDGKLMVTGSWDKTAQVWETATGKRVGASLKHLERVGRITFSPDGKFVLTGSADGTARLWDSVSGRPLTSPLHHQGEIRAVAFSPDGTTMLTANRTVRFWETATGKQLGSSVQRQGLSDFIAFSPDCAFVIWASDDNTVLPRRVPKRVNGGPERIVLWAQLITGLELNEYGDTHGLDSVTWTQRGKRLQEIGGLPEE